MHAHCSRFAATAAAAAYLQPVAFSSYALRSAERDLLRYRCLSLLRLLLRSCCLSPLSRLRLRLRRSRLCFLLFSFLCFLLFSFLCFLLLERSLSLLDRSLRRRFCRQRHQGRRVRHCLGQ